MLRTWIGLAVAASLHAGVVYLCIAGAGSWPFAASIFASLALLGASELASYHPALPSVSARLIAFGGLAAATVAMLAGTILCPPAWMTSLAVFAAQAGVFAGFTPSLPVPRTERRPGLAFASWLMIGVSFAAMLPALGLHQQFTGPDAAHHMKWQHFFSEQMWGGEIYPRWLLSMNDGLGSPSFFIYSPLSHHVTALLYPLAPGMEGVPLRLAFSAGFALAISGIGAFIWLRALPLSRTASIFGALVYILAPYHLAMDIYLRTAFAELWTMAWIPFALWGLVHLNKRQGFAVFTLAVLANLITHTATSVLLLPMYAIYLQVLWFAGEDRSIRSLFWTNVRFGLGVTIALLISSPYFVVAFTQTEFIDMAALSTGYFDPRSWFLDRMGSGINKGAALTIPPVIMVQTLGAFAFAALTRLSRQRRLYSAHIWFAVGLSLVCIILNTSLSRAFWDLETVFNRIQFPWRLLTLQCIALALTGAVAIQALQRSRLNRWLKPLALTCLAGMGVANAALYAAKTYSDHLEGKSPPTMASLLETPLDAPEYRLGDHALSQGLFGSGVPQKAMILSGEGKVSVSEWTPRRLKLEIQATTPVHLAVRQYNYYGWSGTASDDTPLSIRPYSEALPVITTHIPAGTRTVELVLPAQTPETVMTYVSILGMILLVLYLWAEPWFRSRWPPPQHIEIPGPLAEP